MELDDFCPADNNPDASPPGQPGFPDRIRLPDPASESQRLAIQSACAQGLSRLAILGLLRTHLVRHFADPRNITSPELRQSSVWRDDHTTGILVESIFRLRPDQAGKTPALMIKPNSMTNYKVGIGDGMMGLDARGDDSGFMTFWVGSHTIFASHGNGTACEILANEVRKVVMGNAKALRIAANLMRISVTEVGAPSYIKETPASFAAPVVVAWAFGEEWRLQREAYRLNAVGVRVQPKGQ